MHLFLSSTFAIATKLQVSKSKKVTTKQACTPNKLPLSTTLPFLMDQFGNLIQEAMKVWKLFANLKEFIKKMQGPNNFNKNVGGCGIAIGPKGYLSKLRGATTSGAHKSSYEHQNFVQEEFRVYIGNSRHATSANASYPSHIAFPSQVSTTFDLCRFNHLDQACPLSRNCPRGATLHVPCHNPQ